jgi:hypothetical protein
MGDASVGTVIVLTHEDSSESSACKGVNEDAKHVFFVYPLLLVSSTLYLGDSQFENLELSLHQKFSRNFIPKNRREINRRKIKRNKESP